MEKRETLSLKGRPEPTHREHCEKVMRALKGARSDHENDWHSIADFSGYGDLPGLSQQVNGKSRAKMRQLMNSHPVLAFRTVQSGMYSGLSSPNRPWLRFKFADEELNNYQPGAEWIDSLERVILGLFDQSNFYQVARQNYGDMARFGPAAGMMNEHWRKVAPCLALPLGTYWLGVDDAYDVDTLMVSSTKTVDQVVKQFVGRPGGRMDWSAVSRTVQEKWDKSNYAHPVHMMHLMEPGVGEKWQGSIWDVNDDRKNAMLEAKHINEQPFWAPRDIRGYDVYGRGLGHDALADLRELQMEALTKRQLQDQIRKPATVGPAKDLDMRPGAHTHVSDVSEDHGAKVIYQPDPRSVEETRKNIADLKQSIDQLVFADLFMAISNMPGVQPRNIEELIKRDEERLTQIGPVVETVNDDMLPQAVQRMMGIARRGNLLPPAPEELQGRELKLEFVSVLAQAQKMLGMSTTERVVGFVGSLGSVFGPEVLDKVDPDAIVDDYAQRANLPAKAIRDADSVAQLRKGRAEAQQMQEAAAMAGPAKDATAAASNIAAMAESAL